MNILYISRAAAKCNKGIEVVCCVALKSFITVIVRVLRGPAAANKCVRKIRRVIHCCLCEDRAFYPQTVYPLGMLFFRFVNVSQMDVRNAQGMLQIFFIYLFLDFYFFLV